MTVKNFQIKGVWGWEESISTWEIDQPVSKTFYFIMSFERFIQVQLEVKLELKIIYK